MVTIIAEQLNPLNTDTVFIKNKKITNINPKKSYCYTFNIFYTINESKNWYLVYYNFTIND